MSTIIDIANLSASLDSLSIRALRRLAIAKGRKWDSIKGLSALELKELILATQFSWVNEPEAFLTKKLSAIVAEGKGYKLASLKGGAKLLEGFKADGETILESEAFENVLNLLLEEQVEKKMAKAAEKQLKGLNRVTNRAEYLPAITLVFAQTADGSKNHYRFETSLVPTGILPRVIEDMGGKVEGQPLSLRIVNNLPKLLDNDGNPSTVSEPIPATEWDHLRSVGWVPTQGNLAWNFNNSMLKDTMLAMFPKAIDFGAYNHRLNAPLIPGGYVNNLTVEFANPVAQKANVDEDAYLNALKIAVFKYYKAVGLSDETMIRLGRALRDAADESKILAIKESDPTLPLKRFQDEAYALAATYANVDQECDGSGLYNPDHPAMQYLVAKHGKVVFQITVIRPDGLFAKGIIVPREGLASQHPVVLDMAQVKGSMKGKIKEGDVAEGCYLGVMSAFNRKSFYPGCFELLQYVLPTKANSAKVYDAIDSLIAEVIADYEKHGVDGLLADLAKDDEHMRLIISLITQIRSTGTKLDAMAIPMVRRALEDKLSARLWVLAQGAGIRGDQTVTILDASVPYGKCVVAGYKLKERVAIWRFPCVLPQGLVTAEVTRPSPHQMIGGQIIPNAIFLNPQTLVSCMQGDDDGDICGVSNDPRILAIFDARATKKVYLVEPQGSKFDLASDCQEGYEYVQRDNRGPVGMTTIYQAKLLAVGDWHGAVALAVTNQEAIDSAKKRIKWTDFRKLVEGSHWVQDANGCWRPGPNTELDECFYGDDPSLPFGWPGELLKEWVRSRLEMFGCMEAKGHVPLSWRRQSAEVEGKQVRLSKRIHASYWEHTNDKSGKWTGGNVVHYTHNSALYQWRQAFGEEFLPLTAETEAKLNGLIIEVAAQRGVTLSLTASTWEEYLPLRKKAGIEAYGKEFRQMMLTEKDEGQKFGRIEQLTNILHSNMSLLTPNELVTVWYWETTPTWQVKRNRQAPEYFSEYKEGGVQVNRINYAFRACTFPGSPIMEILGMDDIGGCNYMQTQDRTNKSVEYFMKHDQPFAIMSSSLYSTQGHGREKKDDNGNAIALWQCTTCTDHLTSSLIQAWRKSKVVGEKEYMCGLVSTLNGLENRERQMSSSGDREAYRGTYAEMDTSNWQEIEV